MAKTANSKVIFLPAPNQSVQQQMSTADNVGEGPSRYASPNKEDEEGGFQHAINARVVEDI